MPIFNLNLRRIHDVVRRKDRKTIIVPNRRHAARDMSQPPGVKVFTSKMNARSKDAARARNKQARASRKRNRA